MKLSVIIASHNPDRVRLLRTLTNLAGQTLSLSQWEIVLVDNASTLPVYQQIIGDFLLPNMRFLREPKLGLTAARCRGFIETSAPICVLVDDDNVLDFDYLEKVEEHFSKHPQVGALGGRISPEFETSPPKWISEFYAILALRDNGSQMLISEKQNAHALREDNFPWFAPVGAGMALRRSAVQPWLQTVLSERENTICDRRGTQLTSGGDTDILFTILDHGWEVAYCPDLHLTHLIPERRTQVEYLARLNRCIQACWIQVLNKHHANPLPPIPQWTVPFRKFKSWFYYCAWSNPVAYIKWQGACGHFEARARFMT